jgi:hypothetical protein
LYISYLVIATASTRMLLTHLVLDLDQLPLGQSLVVSYDAIVASSLDGGPSVPNTANLNWDQIPGPGGRTRTDTDSGHNTATEPIKVPHATKLTGHNVGRGRSF